MRRCTPIATALRAWLTRPLGTLAGASPLPLASPPSADTIYALASAPGRAAVAVLRLSGPAADAALAALLPPGRPLPPPRRASLATLRRPSTAAPLDTALCLRFPGPRSATGQDVVELHLHGGPAVVAAVGDALASLPGLRPAEAGEFTRRAFAAGRLDLTEVEGLADLLAAQTEAQRALAAAAAGGAARRQCEAWRRRLLGCLARVEAVIDFGEDDEIGDEVAAAAAPEAAALRAELEAHLAAGAGGEVVREGLRVALVGAPNAGKSSLLNALAGREAAIVSPAPGTTRDLLEVALDLGGYKVVVVDGAGVREAADPVEAEGVRRVRAAAAAAHVVVALREPGGCFIDGDVVDRGAERRKPTIRVMNKADLVEDSSGGGGGRGMDEAADLEISCLTGEGLSAFTAALSEAVRGVMEAAGGGGDGGVPGAAPPLLNRARHRHHVSQCVAALRRYEAAPLRLEVAAEELRGAAAALGRVVGAIDTEAVLDSIFAEFCIGK